MGRVIKGKQVCKGDIRESGDRGPRDNEDKGLSKTVTCKPMLHRILKKEIG